MMKAQEKKQARQEQQQEARGINPLRPPLSSFASRSTNPFAPPPRPSSTSQPATPAPPQPTHEHLASSGEILGKTINEFVSAVCFLNESLHLFLTRLYLQVLRNVDPKTTNKQDNPHKALQEGLKQYTAAVTRETMKNIPGAAAANPPPRPSPPPPPQPARTPQPPPAHSSPSPPPSSAVCVV